MTPTATKCPRCEGLLRHDRDEIRCFQCGARQYPKVVLDTPKLAGAFTLPYVGDAEKHKTHLVKGWLHGDNGSVRLHCPFCGKTMARQPTQYGATYRAYRCPTKHIIRVTENEHKEPVGWR